MCLAFTAGSALLIRQGNLRGAWHYSQDNWRFLGNCHECSTTVNKNTDLCINLQLLQAQFTSKLEGVVCLWWCERPSSLLLLRFCLAAKYWTIPAAVEIPILC